MDEFAQTRPQDDLFDDELVPVASQQPYVSKHAPGADAGRNRGGEGAATGGRQPGRRAKRGEQERAVGRKTTEVTVDKKATTSGDMPKSSTGESRLAPDVARNMTKPVAVSGDRSGTGGVKPKRLTEQELAARLEKARLRSAAREEAHRRAEADEASFKEREQIEATKRHEERANRREMDVERERNRARKLKTLHGREWDANKNETDYTASYTERGTRYTRGGHSGPYDRRGSGPSGVQHSQLGRGDGYNRERSHGGPGDARRGEPKAESGRGGKNDDSGDTRPKTPQPPPNVAAPSEFPALPPSTQKDGDEKEDPSPRVSTGAKSSTHKDEDEREDPSPRVSTVAESSTQKDEGEDDDDDDDDDDDEHERPSPRASAFAKWLPGRSHSRQNSDGGASTAWISSPSSKRQSLGEQGDATGDVGVGSAPVPGGPSGPTAPTDKENASKEKPTSRITSPQNGGAPPLTTTPAPPPKETWADQVESAKP
ncbi:MAG: hypothetical protein M1815_001800 [Lichina confinis]|nr:MAG: hypothetical protein M1815_001800 [Lichina confinis]